MMVSAALRCPVSVSMDRPLWRYSAEPFGDGAALPPREELPPPPPPPPPLLARTAECSSGEEGWCGCSTPEKTGEGEEAVTGTCTAVAAAEVMVGACVE